MDLPEPSLLLPSLGLAAHNCKSSPDTCKTSQSSPEESSPTGSTSSTLPEDEERTQSAFLETPPPSPFSHRKCSVGIVTADDGRQPPSPLWSAAATEKIQPLAPCLVQEIDGANCGKQGSRRRRRRRRNVTFTTVTIHHHPPTLSDNPAVSDSNAPGVGLSWHRTHTHHYDVDAYESDRQKAGSERRTSVQQLRMTGAKRRLLLLRAGHTERELNDMIEEVRRVQIGRARTNGTAGRGLDISGKTRRVREAGARARRHVGRAVDAMDRAATIRIQPVGRAVMEFDHGAAAAADSG